MRDNRYFSHDSPTYGTPFQMMKSLGVTYRTAGENIAYGYASPQAVMDGWMNSEGHRANILNPSYTRIGGWWDRKGENEIDLVVIDPVKKEAWFYELKKQGSRYSKNQLREKVDIVIEQTPELRKMTIHLGSLSLNHL